MAKVEIQKINGAGMPIRVAVCELVDQTVVCTGDEAFVRTIQEEGITHYGTKPRTKVFPSSGRDFLELLKRNFDSPYLYASAISGDHELDQAS